MIDTFKQYVLECYPQEAVGIFTNNEFIKLENIHDNPVTSFQISLDDSLLVSKLKDCRLVHSHTMSRCTSDPRTPSYEDMQGKQSTGIPWGIVHCDGTNVTDILWFGEPRKEVTLGKYYISNVDDCFTLARDFYYTHFNVDVGLHPRPADWEEWNSHYIVQNYMNLGFAPIPANTSYKFGDILLFAIGSRIVNHIGIFLEKDKFIHHMHNRVSCEDSISKWHRQLVKVIRR